MYSVTSHHWILLNWPFKERTVIGLESISELNLELQRNHICTNSTLYYEIIIEPSRHSWVNLLCICDSRVCSKSTWRNSETSNTLHLSQSRAGPAAEWWWAWGRAEGRSLRTSLWAAACWGRGSGTLRRPRRHGSLRRSWAQRSPRHRRAWEEKKL